MEAQNFQKTLKALWLTAVRQYESGNRDSGTYFSADEQSALEAVGHSAQEIFDFVDDSIRYEDGPDYETFLMVAHIRFYYFHNVMQGKRTGKIVDTGDLPPKTDAVQGIEWLPRLIEKARAKLRGEMSDDLMYGCGGDRNFFRTHNIHPAEFLQFVMGHFEDEQAIIDFVKSRTEASALS